MPEKSAGWRYPIRSHLNSYDLSLGIRVVAIYGSEDMPTGAWRTFRLNLSASPTRQLEPATIDTHRMNSKSQRKRVLQWAEDIEIHKAY